MMYILTLICIGWAVSLVVLTVIFDVWAYWTTKDFDFVLKAWMNRHKRTYKNMSSKQAALLMVISKAEIGLGYFGLIVVVPLFVISKI